MQRTNGGSFLHSHLSAILMALAVVAPAVAPAAERVVICHGRSASALIVLAKLQGYYADEGIDVKLQPLPSGLRAIEEMLSGNCHLASAAAAPVVQKSLLRNDFRIIASTAISQEFEKVIVRRDRGIRNAADLRGRRIAVPEFTSAHFVLDMILTANGTPLGDVTRVFLQPEEVEVAFRRGEVDAAALWEPIIRKLAGEFGNRASVLKSAGMAYSTFLLSTRQDFLEQHPAATKAILRALIRAERHASTQPVAARTALARYFGMEQADFDFIWTMHDYRIALEQPLLSELERGARWRIGLLPPAERREVPNYFDYIHLDALKAVQRQAVTILH